MVLVLGCAKKTSDTEIIIAEVGERKITLDEFRLFYELDPNFGIDSTGFPALLDELNKYIYQIFAYEKAKDEKLTEDIVFSIAVNWEKRQAMLRQLYREVVSKQFSVTDGELREAFIKYNSEVNVRQLFSAEKSQADEWYLQLSNGKKFELLAKEAFRDTILANNGGNIGWIKLGDLDEEFASAVERLKQNEISEPVQTQWGFHIIQLIDRKENLLINESDFIAKRMTLEKKIRNKKNRKFSKEYIKSYIGKINPQPVPAVFKKLWNAAVPPSEREKSQLSMKVTFTNVLISRVEEYLRNDLDEQLIQSNKEAITIRYFLEALKNMPVGNRPRFKTARQLSDQMGVWIRDEYLMEEARKKRLDTHPEVEFELMRYSEEQSYYFYVNSIVARIETPMEIKIFFERKDPKLLEEFPELRHLHTIQEWNFWKAEQELHSVLKKSPKKISINLPKLHEENQRISWDRRIRMFRIRKPS